MSFLEKQPKVAVAAALILILISLVSLFRPDSPPKFVEQSVSKLFTDMALQAEQIANFLEDGSRVVLMERDLTLKAHRESDYQRIFRALEDGGVSIQHVERLIVDERQGWDPFAPGFPYSEFVRVAGEYPDVDAVISLCGTPYGLVASDRPSSSARPPLLIMNKGWSGLPKWLLDEGWVAGGVVYSEGWSAGDPVEEKYTILLRGRYME